MIDKDDIEELKRVVREHNMQTFRRTLFLHVGLATVLIGFMLVVIVRPAQIRQLNGEIVISTSSHNQELIGRSIKYDSLGDMDRKKMLENDSMVMIKIDDLNNILRRQK